MIDILASTLLTCSEAAYIIRGIESVDISDKLKTELSIEVYRGTDPHCDLPEALAEAKPR